MGAGPELCPICKTENADFYDIQTMGMCRYCAAERMARLQTLVDSLTRQVEYRDQQIANLKSQLQPADDAACLPPAAGEIRTGYIKPTK